MSNNPTTPIIEVRAVSKRYHRAEYRPSLRHEAANSLRRLLRRTAPVLQNQPFFALRDVSFSVQPGEALGIVGRNGSGKTTLLRLISGIMEPSEGTVSVRGRFAALIGLGAGFLPQLSGRKNIYLNAAIHGVSPAQTETLLEAIIDFAELRPFIDSPVKHYSSGMGARLGFSIAAHIMPDIILLDEVLAVGDEAFQEKCLARVQAMKAAGRTILFVSHDAASVKGLCPRSLWLHEGQLLYDGPTTEVFDQYHAMLERKG
jgi:ABC-type polysaccharide/polyol phosphate transport system ATPase subunit